MHSKWQIWDFFSSVKKDYLTNVQGVLGLNTFDPVCLKLVKDYLTRGLPDNSLHHKIAGEITRSWIEDEFQTLSLFGNSESFFIHQAQDLNTELLELISSLDLSGRFLILSFENEQSGWKKIVKEGKVPTLTIESPRFWELNKLLDFVCAYLRLPLSYEAKVWMLESLENNLPSFYNSCCLIKINHPDTKEVSLQQVKELLTLERLDQFQLASLVARRKNKDFYTKLVALSGDFDRMRDFFRFMQGHLVKMADTSYLNDKPRLNQYDKELQSTSKLWKSEELFQLIGHFNRWEILSKKKDQQLWHEIKEAHLRSLTP